MFLLAQVLLECRGQFNSTKCALTLFLQNQLQNESFLLISTNKYHKKHFCNYFNVKGTMPLQNFVVLASLNTIYLGNCLWFLIELTVNACQVLSTCMLTNIKEKCRKTWNKKRLTKDSRPAFLSSFPSLLIFLWRILLPSRDKW